MQLSGNCSALALCIVAGSLRPARQTRARVPTLAKARLRRFSHRFASQLTPSIRVTDARDESA
jgi:hypothetical protein